MTKSTVISGKRKRSIARASIKQGKGTIRVNGSKIEVYEPKLARERIMEPIRLIPDEFKKVDIDINCSGGGVTSMADAARLAISRAIVEHTKNDKIKDILLNYDRTLLVADVRRKEMRKPNDSKARAKRQKSYR